VKRLTGTLERCSAVITSEFRKDFRRLPEPVRTKFLEAVAELSKKTAELR
jgi:mRNA-degrading endonuclease RelE of RelBE toxin-antitoxin system